MSRSHKDKTWPKSIMLAHFKILAHFKGILCRIYVYNVMKIFCLVFYMTNFLNCICLKMKDKVTERNKVAQMFKTFSRLY